MNELKAGTFVLMVKNEDESFSPVGMSKEQAYIICSFLSGMSKENPFIINDIEKYVQAT